MTGLEWTVFGVAAGAFVASFLLVRAVRRFAVSRGMLDHPDDRRSHDSPVPRGGGIAVSIVQTGAFVVLWTVFDSRRTSLLLLLGALAAVAVVGWLDDRRGLGPSPRLGVHALAGLLVAIAAMNLVPGAGWMPGLWFAFWLFWTVASVNVVNFMDGIDGLVASQTIIAGAYIALLAPWPSLAAGFSLCLAAAMAGFLLWNWSPARIFLGDAGSGSAGLLLVLAGLLTVAAAGAGVVRVFLPLCPMFLDATVTLWRRWRRGERVTRAHRSHLYQRLANGAWGHARTSLCYVAASVAGALVGLAPFEDAPFIGVAVVYAAALLAVGSVLDRRVPA